MKAKELIQRLQQFDPDVEVCVDNKDIYFLEPKPAYWDGKLQLLLHDPAKRDKAWSIIGAKVVEKGNKLNIVAMSIEDAIWDVPDLPVDLSELCSKDEWEQRVTKYRADVNACLQEIEQEEKARGKTNAPDPQS